ncbi:MAG: TolB-like protein [Psychroserpens sp.]|jgi:TolB-like protein
MLKITKLLSITLLTTALSACSSLQLLQSINPLSALNSKNPNSERLCANDDGTFYICQDMALQNIEIKSHPSLFSTNLHFNRLAEYTEQMAADLQRDVRGMQVDQPIVVASFVHLDSSLQNTDTLGIQLAESFINELQQIGLPVADHKLMGVLDVNDKGDFAFSRNMGQFYNEVNIGYVLSGTMVKNSRGWVVNARLINFRTNAVVASSSKFLPNVVINNLL